MSSAVHEMPVAARRRHAGPSRWRWGSNTSMLAFAALLIWAPLPLASNRPWSLALLAMALWLLLAWQAHLVWRGQAAAPARGWAGAWPLALLAGPALVVLAQLLAQAWWPDLPWLGTANAHASRLYLLAALAYAAAGALVLLLVTTRRRCLQLLAALLAGGVLQALLAVVLHATRARHQLFFTDFDQGHRAMGTFPNPDHLAGYLELCLAAGLGLMLSQLGGGQAARHWHEGVSQAMAFVLSAKMLVRLMLVLMVVALVMTHSRMGNAAFFLAMLGVGALVAALSRQLRRPAVWLVASMALVDIIIVGQWVGLDRVVDRLQETAESTQVDAAPDLFAGAALPPRREESLQQRLQVPLASTELVMQQPWFGHGGGTYEWKFSAVKPAGFPHAWNHAHNDYVEVAADIGLVGLAFGLVLAAATLFRAARLLRDDTSRPSRGVGVAAWMALTCMALHSMVDFNLQIPANALTLTVLVMLVWATPRQWPEEPTGRQAQQARQAGEAGQAGESPWPEPSPLSATAAGPQPFNSFAAP